jgi:hypothetical protein
MSKPNRIWKRLRSGRISVDCLALDEAIKAGSLSREDRAMVDEAIPNLCDRLELRVRTTRSNPSTFEAEEATLP